MPSVTILQDWITSWLPPSAAGNTARFIATCHYWTRYRLGRSRRHKISESVWSSFFVDRSNSMHLSININRCKTSGSAIAEGPRDVLVSRNSATTKYRYRVALIAWSYVQPFLHNTEVWLTHPHRRTERYTATACTALSIASRGKNQPYCTAHQVQLPGNERRLIANF